MIKTFEFFWDDLSQKCQQELRDFLGDDDDVPNNWDVFPIASLDIEDED